MTPTPEQSALLMEKYEILNPKQEAQMVQAREMKPTMDKLHVAGTHSPFQSCKFDVVRLCAEFWNAGLVKKNLLKNKGIATSLTEVLVDAAGEKYRERAIALTKSSKKAFDETMALYSNATGGEEDDAKIAEDDSE